MRSFSAIENSWSRVLRERLPRFVRQPASQVRQRLDFLSIVVECAERSPDPLARQPADDSSTALDGELEPAGDGGHAGFGDDGCRRARPSFRDFASDAAAGVVALGATQDSHERGLRRIEELGSIAPDDGRRRLRIAEARATTARDENLNGDEHTGESAWTDERCAEVHVQDDVTLPRLRSRIRPADPWGCRTPLPSTRRERTSGGPSGTSPALHRCWSPTETLRLRRRCRASP
jgi:hypothetical protein